MAAAAAAAAASTAAVNEISMFVQHSPGGVVGHGSPRQIRSVINWPLDGAEDVATPTSFCVPFTFASCAVLVPRRAYVRVCMSASAVIDVAGLIAAFAK